MRAYKQSLVRWVFLPFSNALRLATGFCGIRKTRRKNQESRIKPLLALAALTTTLLLHSLFFILTQPAQAATGINNQINFQGKLVNPDGTNVADGTYNLQFKIYEDGNGILGGGDETLKWTETRLRNNSQGVTVTNGIFQVNLGSVNPLGSSIDFNQDTLWLSMHIGGTNATCAPFSTCAGAETEMSPFIRFTATPYALNSGALQGLNKDQFTQLAQGLQTDASTANASIAINKTGTTANILTLQRGGADVQVIANDGSALFKNQTDSATGFRIQSATAAQTLFTADTTANKIKIGDSTGTDTSTTLLQVDSTTADPTTLTSRNGGLFYNSTLDQLKVIEAGAVARVCTTTAVCSGYAPSAANGYVQLAPASVQVDASTNNSIYLNKTGASGNIVQLQKGGADKFVIDNNGGLTVDTNTLIVDASNDIIGIGTTSGAAKLTVFDSSTSTTLTDFTQAINKAGINIATNYLNNGYAPGLFFSTQDNNAAKPKAGIFSQNSGTGTSLLFGTSNNYATGITNTALAIDPSGNVGIGTTAPSQILTLGEGADRTINVLTRTTNVVGNGLSIIGGAAGSGASAFTGGSLTLKGGNAAGTGNANGADVIIQGGSGVGTGVQGLISLSATSLIASSTQSFGAGGGTLTQSVVDSYSVIPINATNGAPTIVLPAPTQNVIGRILYLSAVNGSNSFTISPSGGVNFVLGANASATFLWNGTGWTNAGVDSGSASFILNQINTQQTSANFWLSGTGRADTSLITPLIQTPDISSGSSNSLSFVLRTGNISTASSNTTGSITIKSGDSTASNNSSGNIVIDSGTKSGSGTAGSVSLGATNASSIILGRAGITTTVNGSLTVSTGGTFTNASSTLFTAIAITDKPAGGTIGTAAATVDVATTFDVNQTTASQTLTLPNPTVATAGRIGFVSNVGSTSFTMYGVIISPSTTSIFFWNGTVWTPAGVDGSGANYIQNQNSGDQTANFRISGTGRANTGLESPNLERATNGTLSIGTTSTTTALTLGSANAVGASALVLDSGASSTITIGSSTVARTINIGNVASGAQSIVIGSATNTTSTLSLQGGTGTGTPAITLTTGATGGTAGTISIGNTTGANTQTINLGTNATASSTTTLNIGSTIAGITTLQSAGGVKLTTQLAATANSVALCRDSSTTSLTACNTTGTGATFVQGGNTFAALASLGTNDSNNLQIHTGGAASSTTIRATFDQSNSLYLGNGVTAATPSAFTVQGTGSTTAGTAGGALTVKGGAGTTATTGSAGGALILQGGVGGTPATTGNATVGGAVNITGGAASGLGAATALGGAINIQAGNSFGTTTGSGVNITGGTAVGTNQNGGNVTLQGGAPTGSGAYGHLILQNTGGNVGIGIAVPTAKLDVKGSTSDSTANALNILNNTGTNYLAVRNDGNVSIGQTPSSQTIFGFNTVGGTVDSDNDHWMNATQFTMGASAGTVSSMSAYVVNIGTAPNNQFQFAIYTNKASGCVQAGVTECPDQLVPGATSVVGTLGSAGWNSLSLSASLSGSTKYWLVYNTNAVGNNNNNLVRDAGGTNQNLFLVQTFGTYPSTFGNTTGNAPQQFSMYATITPSGSTYSSSLTVSSAGNVGIDTPSPQYKFQVQGATTSVLAVNTTNSRVGINLAASDIPSADLSFGSGNRVINVVTQTTTNTVGGTLTINSGIGNGTGAGGALTVQPGNGGSTGNGGAVVVQGGTAGGTSGTGGAASLVGGTAVGAFAGGQATLQGGAAAATAASNSGAVAISTLNGSTTGSGGNAGNIVLTGGNAGGTGARSGGSISLTAGNSSATGTGAAGTISLQAGTANATNTAGGAITVTSGTGNGTQAGGALTLAAGTGGATGTGGLTTLRGGTGGATSGAGGAVTIQGGNAAAGVSNGGTVTISGGAKNSTGTSGTVIIKPQASNDSTTSFQVQNAAAAQLLNVDSTDSNITLLGNNSGEPKAWTTTTALGTAHDNAGSVSYNGHMYLVTGDSGGALHTTVAYSKLNADGTLNAWATTGTSMPTRNYAAVTQANGYIYVIGGTSVIANTDVRSEVYYAKINQDGTVGTFATTSALTNARKRGTAVILNGYIYHIGGDSSANATPAAVDDVYYAKLNADGTVGTWSLVSNGTNGLPAARYAASAITANGLIYVLGGAATGGAAQTSVYYVRPLSTGDISSAFTAEGTNPLAAARYAGGVYIANGYVYYAGGQNAGTQPTVHYSPLNANGSLGTWVQQNTANDLPANRESFAYASANGYFYAIGGWTGSGAATTAYHTSTTRVRIGGSLDLIGIGGENLAEGGTGGNLTAGNTQIVGSLQVTDMANFLSSVTVERELRVGGSVLFKNLTNSTTAFQVQSASSTTPIFNIDSTNSRVGIGTAAPTADLSFGGEAAQTIKMEARTGNAAGNNLTIAAGAAGAGASAFTGGQLNLQGGAAGGTGNANGGAVSLAGGAGVGTGTQGLVSLSTTAFSAASVQTFASPGTFAITAGNVDLYSTLPVTASVASVIVTVPDPNQSISGRIVYIAARSGSNDFTLRLNSARTPIDIAMKANSTATLIWNGTDWTAAGASSSTDLQSAYNNTLTSAGGAELVLNASGGAADGLTIRNNGTTPISGGILEVQSAIGTNLFSVNNFGTELAANGGSETLSTFTTNWTAAPAGGTVTRTTTAGQFVTGLAGAQVVTTTTTNTGLRNNLSGNPINTIGAAYQVSFTAKSSLSGTAIDVQYSRNGGTNLTACTNYGAAGAQNLSDTVWTKITCTITIDSATAATDPDLYIRKTDAATAPTIYIDNLSFIRNDTTTQPSNVQVGGGINGGPVTLFTLDRASAPPVANGNTTYLGSMYYDTTTGRIQCYESDGWGACGSAPDNIIVLTPEYSGAVLNGNGIGTLTADFCANQASITFQVNQSFCTAGLSRQYYKWTSPQSTEQIYSIYVSYKLPNTFKTFNSDSTITLTALSDNVSNGFVTYEVFRSTGAAISRCSSGPNETPVTSTVNTWETIGINGTETSCGFVGGDNIIFKINVKSKSNANVYVENLNFTYTNN